MCGPPRSAALALLASLPLGCADVRQPSDGQAGSAPSAHGAQAATAAPADPSIAPKLAWLEEKTRELLRGSRVAASDGTVLYTPDGKGNYRALWTRDFAYMVEGAGDLLPSKRNATRTAPTGRRRPAG
jgi:hypothetical protein